MKHIFNSSLWLIIIALVISSCSKDEDVQPDFDDVAFTFDAENPPVTIPQGLQSSSDSRALLANAFLNQAYAYQVSETNTHYVFELFLKVNNDDYIKYWHSEQSKTGKQGFLELFGDYDDDYTLRYEWAEVAGVFHFDMITSDTTINIISNPDHSGSLKVYEDGQLETEITWNASGTAGTYAEYDSDGNLEESGTWPE